MSALDSFLSKEGQNYVVAAIKEAELNTSGEIRVHLEAKCKGSVTGRAFEVFKKLKIYDTQARNGVLIYIAFKSHDVAIIGDEGINSVVPEGFWDEIYHLLQERFRSDEVAEGLKSAILKIGEKLKVFFPYQDNDVNEQSDEISIG